MPTTCYVPSCKSGYRSNTDKEKRHFFRVKKGNFTQLEEWARLIPRKDRPLTYSSNICDLHFDNRYIQKYYKHVINGVNVKINMGNWRLSADAKPTIFSNCPSYLSKNLPKQRSSPSTRKNCISKRRCSKKREMHTDKSSEFDAGSEIEHGNLSAGTTLSSPQPSRTSITPGLIAKRERIYNQQQSLKRCKRKIRFLQTENKNLKKALQNRSEMIKENMGHLPRKQQLILEHFLRANETKSSNGMRYNVEWILDCILMYIRSPSNYEFMRINNLLPLPEKTTLRRYISNLDAKFGWDNQLFERLKEKLQDFPERDRLGVLMWDEISLQSHVEYNKHTGKLIGFIDFGNLTDKTAPGIEGDHALVFLFQPYLNNWTQTISVFCAKGATPGTTLAKLIVQAIINLEKAGAIVTATTCDGSSTNKTALSALGIDGEKVTLKNYFCNPAELDRQVFVIFDVPHIFKCIRNNLLKVGKFKVPDGIVSMDHYTTLYMEES